jgi:hypothetical protein
MVKWQYMTWRVGDFGGASAHVRIVDGEELERKERPPFYEALARAGEDGWELVGMDSDTLIFKRPLSET